MPQPVSNPPDIAPRHPWTSDFRFNAERTAASLMTSNLRSTSAIVLGSSRNASNSIPAVNCSIMPIAPAISRGDVSASLKGKHGLACCSFPNAVLQHPCRRKVYSCAEHISKPVFQPDPVQQGKFASGIEFRHEIDIRLRRGFVPSDGAKQGQPHDACAFQLGFMLAECGDVPGTFSQLPTRLF